MKNPNLNPLNSDRNKYKKFILDSARKAIIQGTGLTITELKKNRSESSLYYIGLKHLTTTNKVVCLALGIAVEAGTRYKRSLQKRDLLVSTLKKKRCPFTTYKAHFLTADKSKFETVGL